MAFLSAFEGLGLLSEVSVTAVLSVLAALSGAGVVCAGVSGGPCTERRRPKVSISGIVSGGFGLRRATGVAEYCVSEKFASFVSLARGPAFAAGGLTVGSTTGLTAGSGFSDGAGSLAPVPGAPSLVTNAWTKVCRGARTGACSFSAA